MSDQRHTGNRKLIEVAGNRSLRIPQRVHLLVEAMRMQSRLLRRLSSDTVKRWTNRPEPKQYTNRGGPSASFQVSSTALAVRPSPALRCFQTSPRSASNLFPLNCPPPAAKCPSTLYPDSEPIAIPGHVRAVLFTMKCMLIYHQLVPAQYGRIREA